ncbi:hypothetical protein BV22DRAFT_616653 [Leucogyrophana mollusca]|uniref:Uncharacterized protein n=1 Tax=Leucogyrophana mollusca TaxID=85980 RepID=A0ACB8BBX2_9AGAM|nr:hypothetical protein BV22DRAFT_616653 [Leucogyrophana mollusca]
MRISKAKAPWPSFSWISLKSRCIVGQVRRYYCHWHRVLHPTTPCMLSIRRALRWASGGLSVLACLHDGVHFLIAC